MAKKKQLSVDSLDQVSGGFPGGLGPNKDFTTQTNPVAQGPQFSPSNPPVGTGVGGGESSGLGSENSPVLTKTNQ